MAGRDDDANPFAAPKSDWKPVTLTPTSDTSGDDVNFGQRPIAATIDKPILQFVDRYFAKILFGTTCLIDNIIQPSTEQKQASHDIIAKTLVVKA